MGGLQESNASSHVPTITGNTKPAYIEHGKAKYLTKQNTHTYTRLLMVTTWLITTHQTRRELTRRVSWSKYQVQINMHCKFFSNEISLLVNVTMSVLSLFTILRIQVRSYYNQIPHLQVHTCFNLFSQWKVKLNS